MASDLENWTLDKWLKKVGFRTKYKQAFIDNGYTTADLCANLSKEDLDAIGVTNKQHRGSLFTHSRKLLELVDRESFLASTEIVEVDDRAKSKSKTKGNTPSPKLSSGHTPPPPATPPPPTNPPPPSASQLAPLPDYSEPWNSKAISPAAARNGLKNTIAATVPGDTTDGPSPAHLKISGPSPVHRKTSGPGSGSKKKPPTSPGAELPAYKREGSAGTTRTKLQLKLKIREELFARGVVLTEPPYCWEVSGG